MSPAGLLNTAWMLACAGEARAFRRSTRRVAAEQAAVLRAILCDNHDTEFGRAHGFRALADVRAYQQRVPLSRYEDYAGAVERIAAGRRGVLTRERVCMLEPTSGTTGGEKLIPFTASLRRQFQRAIAVWVHDLFRGRPAVRRGRAYWSLSPALGPPRRTAGGIPVGFEDDAAYLGLLERFALGRLLVVPPEVARLGDMETFRYCTLRCLLRAGDLALVSIWNPTFLPALLAPLELWGERLCRDLHDGTLRPPSPVPPEVAARLTLGRPDRRRAGAVQAALDSGRSLAEKLRRLWPRLALISCWADAAVARGLDELRALFPSVEMQPKGLLATEGCVTVPLLDCPAPALAVRSHFFEFQEADGADGPCRLAHELELGGRYRVVLTTGGGLYRYQLRDEVQVAGFLNQCPLLRFLGKADRISDLVGEKLAEPHVRAVLDRVLAGLGLRPRFAMLAPAEGGPARYRLYLQDAAAGRTDIVTALQEELEAGLEENPYYRHAVRLGQLAAVEVWLLEEDGEPGWQVYERHCRARGQKAGAIKPAALDPWTGWADEFAARAPAASR
jgi:hypothetical protein